MYLHVPPEQVVGANHSLLVVKPEAEADAEAEDSNVRDVGRLIRRQIVAEARKHIFRKVFVAFLKLFVNLREPWSRLSGAKHSTKLIASDVLLI